MTKKKRTLSPEHLAKLQAGRERAQQRVTSISAEPTTKLDLTKETVPTESDLIERIRRMFDEGHNPDVIRVTSRQMMDILDPSARLYNYQRYDSPFGEHFIQVIPAKDIV